MENTNINTIIESITCPITQMPMTNPVTGSDGQTYEKEAIIRWLNEKHTSPHNRTIMEVSSLKLNISIKFLCDKYHAGELGNINSVVKNTSKVSDYSIKLDHKISKTTNNNYLMLNFNIDDNSMPKDLELGYLSQDIILVIDRSGSMQAPIEAKDSNGDKLENGMSIQDIVNHAAKTVAKTLDKNSRLAVIAFDNEIVVISELMFMTEMNKITTLSNIDNIKPRYQTNIWGGIEKAIQILDERDDKSRNSAILMLTDGQPNVSPARGEVETLKKLRIKKNFTAPIYTFGFGYVLKPELLYDIAKYANGANGHIPDGGMIATVFCNFTGTILCTVVNNLQLHINNKDITMKGDYAYNYDTTLEEIIYDIGTVQLEQTRNIVLNNEKNIEKFSYYFTYKVGGFSYKSEIFDIDLESLNIDNNINIHKNRYDLVESIRYMINYNRCNLNYEAMKVYSNIENQLLTSGFSDELTLGMIKNLKGDGFNEGQIKLAVSNMRYFKRWGEFYLDQLSRSLNQQIKPNFKDEACVFGGTIFTDCVDRASDIFDTLPPPTPSLIVAQNYRSLGYQSIPRAPINMSAYNDPGGGCFDSNCIITMADGSKKILKNLKAGDNIMSAKEDNTLVIAKVVCILEIKNTTRIKNFVDFNGGLYITPWHPIKYNNEWVFPGNIKEPNIKQSNSIITLVLDKYHIGFINDYQCIMLGHNFKNGILNHPYYGTNKVIDDLKQSYGWNCGYIVINDYDMILNISNSNKVDVKDLSNNIIEVY